MAGISTLHLYGPEQNAEIPAFDAAELVTADPDVQRHLCALVQRLEVLVAELLELAGQP